MPTKDEIEDNLNEFFGTDIEWSRLNKEDMRKVADIATNPKDYYDFDAQEDRTFKALKAFLKSWQGPIVSRAREVYKKLKDIANKVEEFKEE